MRLVFAGTPEFAATALRSLLKSGYEIALVLTQPDRPAGRGLKPSPSPVKVLADEAGLRVLQPQTLKDPDIQKILDQTGARAMIVAAYGLILPRAVLDIPPLGCLNIHASLLPRWRGAAPIQRAILSGDKESGITIMQMEPGLDTGPMLLQEKVTIEEGDTAGSLHDKLAILGGRCIVQALDALEHGKLTAVPQDEALATYASKIAKDEANLDWRSDAQDLARRVKAFNPFPGASGSFKRLRIKIWRATLVQAATSGSEPGQVIEAGPNGIQVACGRDSLRLEILQKPGSRPLSAREFLSGFRMTVGDRFDL